LDVVLNLKNKKMEGTLVKKGKKWIVKYTEDGNLLEMEVDSYQADALNASKNNHKVVFEQIWIKEKKWIALISFKTI
jgi:hypothetical protein